MNSLNSDSKFVKFVLVAILVTLIVLVVILGCYGLVLFAATQIERGYSGYNAWDAEASQLADRTPQWSSDGQRIVVNVEDRIVGVNVNGGEPLDIRGRKQYSPSLSRDGRVAYETRPSGGREQRIALTDPPGSELEVLPREKHHYAVHPVWSRDGKHLAFITYTSPASTLPEGRWLTIVDATGSGETHPIPLDSKSVLHKPVWSNDGNHIALLESYATGNPSPYQYRYRLRTISRDGKDVRIFTGTLADFKTVGVSLPTWSLGDDRLYFIKRNRHEQLPSGLWNSSLYSVGSDGTNENMIADLGDITVGEIKLSPDGSMLLLGGSYVVNVRGAGLMSFLTDFGVTPGYASWSPDGSKIAVFTGEGYLKYGYVGDGGRLYTMVPDGSDVRTLLSCYDTRKTSTQAPTTTDIKHMTREASWSQAFGATGPAATPVKPKLLDLRERCAHGSSVSQ